MSPGWRIIQRMVIFTHSYRTENEKSDHHYSIFQVDDSGYNKSKSHE